MAGSEKAQVQPLRVVYLFCEGETELCYLQQLERDYRYKLILVKRVSSPAVLLDSALRWAVNNAKTLRNNPNLSIWVVFDYDGKEREIQDSRHILSTCPTKGCGVRGCKHLYGACKARDVIENIHVAFMSPCIELWGIMCTEIGSRLKKFALDRHKLQSQLHQLMPQYNHKSGAEFDVEKMTQTKLACQRARQWERTYGGYPQCIHASHYTGIYRLVELIYGEGLRQ